MGKHVCPPIGDVRAALSTAPGLGLAKIVALDVFDAALRVREAYRDWSGSLTADETTIEAKWARFQDAAMDFANLMDRLPPAAGRVA